MDRRRDLMGELNARDQGIPSAYQEVDWIGYSGSGKMLVTPIKCSQLTDVVADIAKTALPGTNSGSVFPSTFVPGGSGPSTSDWGTLENLSHSNFTASPAHTKEQLFERTTISSKKGSPASTNFVGIGYNAAKFCPALRFYSLRVLNGDTVLFDGVPCYRKSDSKIGMYDLISKSFVESTGTWTKGADVT